MTVLAAPMPDDGRRGGQPVGRCRSSAHVPIHPLWLCRACAQPYPCGEACLALLQYYQGDRVGLSHRVTSMYREALGDLTKLNPHDGPTPADIFRRFLTWPP